ncbi:hypothetical protein BT93_G2091 [Corymbia citriodora subsp. variegata]|nr:hypothetical protein BT93_G2091 [Corymbia citriodora subsp. variegata]
MLSGVKFIPRDQIDERQGESSDSAAQGQRRSGSRKEKYTRKKKGSRYESSDDEELEQIRKAPRRKKWYSSEEYSSSRSSGSGDDDSPRDERRRRDRSKNGGSKRRKRKSKSGRKTSEDLSSLSGSEKSDNFEGDARKEKHRKGSKKDGRKRGKEGAHQNPVEGDFDDQNIVRREMGLEWMLRPEQKTERSPPITVDKVPLETANEESMKVDPRELNPYLKNNGSGYPEEDRPKSGGDRLIPSSVVGDGGASWRLKALKRAKEQAARDGRDIEEVVGERWGSLGHLAVSAASHRAAPSRAHLDSIRNRRRGLTEEQQTAGQDEEDGTTKKTRNYLKDVSLRNPDMRVPKVGDSLSWRKRRDQDLSARDADAELISSTMSNLNKYSNDGSFMQTTLGQQRNILGDSSSSQPAHGRKEDILEENRPREAITQVNEGLSANQLAAKALQLRMKGKHEEAEKLLQEVENLRNKQLTSNSSLKSQNEGGKNRNVLYDVSHQRKVEDDADRHLAKTIMQNRRFSTSGQADDEYDFDGPPRKRSQKKGASNDQKSTQSSILAKRILTQQERCFYCFENPNRPRHLVASIANFTYLMLPPQQPVVPGHCCIVTMQHESSTRTVDDNVWEEIRNFKKCLIMMFAKQEKDLVFLETVMGLAQQRRHCLIECLPLPREVANDAPLYFKKAIDEAEDEWSQHNAKKLIDTSVKGLRASIPKDFPYFHVEFGLNRGFVHVIDDEKDFKSSLGLDVIRGMMRLPEEDMHRRRRSESMDTQKQAVANFVQDWEPFDWTKQLD